MKKIAYQTPEVKVKALFMESLMQGSGLTSSDLGITNGGSDDEGTMDPEAKDGLKPSSVWDD